ncbi:MAG: DNA repair protein RecN [Bacteroidales bacterium]|jgi:DNA repair protein RecN (Recombination protein N)|nr:DNA repair protein RecN [Bacteroidales bacterium]
MLLSLHIENYALIKSLHIRFDDKFTTLTGETGAGKSIILGAFSLILGNRADSSVLYHNAKKCIVEGEFDIENLDLVHFFENYDIDYDSVVFLRREILESGKSRAFINDTPVTLPILKELASQLVDIHSQHQTLLINDTLFRTNLIDQFANNEHLRKEYAINYHTVSETENRLSVLQKKFLQNQSEKEYLLYLHYELEEAHLQENEQLQIEEQIHLLSSAETIQTKIYSIVNLLSDDEQNILSNLKEISKISETLLPYGEQFKRIYEQINESFVSLQELSYELSKNVNSTTFNPEILDSLQKRLDIIYFLEQKHHVKDLDELLVKQQQIATKLDSIQLDEEQIQELEENIKIYRAQLSTIAEKLSQSRRAVLPNFEALITEKLQLLGMENGQFKVKMVKRDHFATTGVDDIWFYFSANKGIEIENITKTASGGELSRLMLAIKSIITQASLLPTIVFDEIDTGISGETAVKVANMMKNLSHSCQLITITHLPQIAAKGNLHYFVFKENSENTTYTSIQQLNNEERILEIAKMISGQNISESAKLTAKELINEA